MNNQTVNPCDHKWKLIKNDFFGDRNVPGGVMRIAPYLRCVKCDEVEHDVKNNWNESDE